MGWDRERERGEGEREREGWEREMIKEEKEQHITNNSSIS